MNIRLFNHPIPLPFVILGIIEVLILVASVYAGAYIRFYAEPEAIENELGNLLEKAIPFAIIMMTALVAMGLYRGRIRLTGLEVVLRVAVSFVLGAVALALMFYVFPTFFVGRGVLGIAGAISFLGLVAARLLFFSVVDEDIFRRRVIVLGTGQKAELLTRLRRRSDQRTFKIVGFLPTGDEQKFVQPDLVITREGALPQLVNDLRAEELVVAIDDRRKSLPVRDLLDCKLNGTKVVDVMTFFERETGRVRLDLLYPSWMIFSEGFVDNNFSRATKRIFDILGSASVLLVTWPIMVVAAVAISLESGWGQPILYRQRRVGLKAKAFDVLKFRSMVVNAEAKGAPQWAAQDDDRVTKVGRVMRKYRVDELPQLWNVFLGDMSIVGPRPERPEFVESLAQTIPYYTERHCAKPGITGWAQLCYQYGSSEDDAAEKLQYDLYYVKNQSIMFDLFILLQTAEVVLLGKGAR